MGRHRRSAAGRAATGHATEAATPGQATEATDPHGSATAGDGPHASSAGRTVPMGIAPYLNPEAYAEADAKARAYLFAEGDGPAASAAGGSAPAGGPSSGHRHRRRVGRPVRAGLLGVSAAVALGTVAVATGVMPGLEHHRLGGSTNTTGADRVQAAGSPSNTASEQGGTSGSADAGPGSPADAPARSQSPSRPASKSPSASTSPSPSTSASASASASASKPVSPAPASKPASAAPTPSRTASGKTAPGATPSRPKTTPPRRTSEPATPTKAPAATSAPGTVTTEATAEAEVLQLVNAERAKVGCSALAANSSLTGLAEAFSDDMAARGFFGHTDPDGATPWDRAAKASITDLGGENIARGQATAAAVMEAWMNSPGHRANILNCDFKTLGVGVHFGPGGPWWTQDFGY
ncbi:CAP domain-containing protein [Streptomyces sp. NPDC048514]|uniref:CAP domain-containing protein n=1 Tax=Streptomyces sp. NPDC048514 TaxID=3365564 RepID=UPI003710C6D2